MLNHTSTTRLCFLATVALALHGCRLQRNRRGKRRGKRRGSGGGSGSVATDCMRPIVGTSDASGQTAISAELNGDWPADPIIHATVQFTSSTQISEFTNNGQTVQVSDSSGDAVSMVKVWITGSDGFQVECRTWATQP